MLQNLKKKNKKLLQNLENVHFVISTVERSTSYLLDFQTTDFKEILKISHEKMSPLRKYKKTTIRKTISKRYLKKVMAQLQNCSSSSPETLFLFINQRSQDRVIINYNICFS